MTWYGAGACRGRTPHSAQGAPRRSCPVRGSAPLRGRVLRAGQPPPRECPPDAGASAAESAGSTAGV